VVGSSCGGFLWLLRLAYIPLASGRLKNAARGSSRARGSPQDSMDPQAEDGATHGERGPEGSGSPSEPAASSQRRQRRDERRSLPGPAGQQWIEREEQAERRARREAKRRERRERRGEARASAAPQAAAEAPRPAGDGPAPIVWKGLTLNPFQVQ